MSLNLSLGLVERSITVELISSLTFHTNERKHEAFHAVLGSDRGRPQRVEFHAEIHDRREFGGFFGSCDSYALNSLGLYVKPILSGVGNIKKKAYPLVFRQY